jgi:hypothetical protein
VSYVGAGFRIQSDVTVPYAARAIVPESAAHAVIRSPVIPGVMSARDRVLRSVLSENDHGGRPFIIVDKQAAEVRVYSAQGKPVASVAALLGAARGDDTAPGVADKPFAAFRAEEKTTPAGRFVAELGKNLGDEDVVWVDYEAAISMHRVRATSAKERRLQRLASSSPADNRISFGCINVPKRFFDDVLLPMFRRSTAVIYVMPETRSIEATFDVVRRYAGSSRSETTQASGGGL